MTEKPVFSGKKPVYTSVYKMKRRITKFCDREKSVLGGKTRLYE